MKERTKVEMLQLLLEQQDWVTPDVGAQMAWNLVVHQARRNLQLMALARAAWQFHQEAESLRVPMAGGYAVPPKDEDDLAGWAEEAARSREA